MKLMSVTWQKLYRAPSTDWTAAVLEPCSLDELEALSRLMGVAHSGTKPQRIERLLRMAAVRAELGEWGEPHGDHAASHALAAELEKRYTRKRLMELAKQAGVFYSINKRGLVLGLLQWRDACRRRGREFNRQLQENSVKQIRMF